jgi:four helix bundle protein
MSRDHTKLRVFHAAHQLALDIYKETLNFPRHEWFGLRLQIRKAAVSTPSNIVEGSARRSTREYCNFLNIALGSASELAYLIGLATELGFLNDTSRLVTQARAVVRQMQRLVDSAEALRAAEEAARAKRASGPKPGA